MRCKYEDITIFFENLGLRTHQAFLLPCVIKTEAGFLGLFSFFNVYLFLREKEEERERGRGRDRGRHRIGSRL